MNIITVVNVVLIAAAVVWILWKQVRPAAIKPRALVAAPLVMGFFGVKDTPSSTWHSGTALTLIAIGAAFSIALGLARGATITVWRGQDDQMWRQGSKYTMFLWAALLVVRIIVAGVASAAHNHAATGTGPILLSLALTFAAQNVVTGLRMNAIANSATPAPAAWPPSETFKVSQNPEMQSPLAPNPEPQPTIYREPTPSSIGFHNRIEQRRADRHNRRASRRESRYNRYNRYK